MKDLSEILIALIRSCLTGEPLAADIKADLSEEMVSRLYSVAYAHSVTHLVAHGLYKNGLLDSDSDVCAKFKKNNFAEIFQLEQMQYEIRRVSQLFEQQEIPFLPLKGAVLRAYYPEPWMRNSCDVDILVHPEDLDRAIDALCNEFGYKLASRDFYDVSMFAPSGMHLELHFALMEKCFPASQYLDKFWENAAPVAEGKMEHKLTDDMFYFHQVIHLAKHFVSGGCGIRLFMDLWVLNQHKAFNPTGGYVAFLENLGLQKLEQQARLLSEVWFSGKEHTELTRKLESFVMDSGVYGTVQNSVTMGQLKNGGKNQYAISRVFLPYEKIREHYPILKEKKYLTPLYQVKRWFKVIREGRLRKSVEEIQVNFNVDTQTKDLIHSLMTELDLIS